MCQSGVPSFNMGPPPPLYVWLECKIKASVHKKIMHTGQNVTYVLKDS